MEIDEILIELQTLPRETLVYKNINGKKQPYLQWSEHGKTKSRYIKLSERHDLIMKLRRKEELKKELKEKTHEFVFSNREELCIEAGEGNKNKNDDVFPVHTAEQKKMINTYMNSVDHDVHEFVEYVLKGNDRLNYITVAFLSESASKTIEELTSKKVEGSRVVLDINAVKHIINRHGASGKQDRSMMDIDDISRIGFVISNYDTIEYDGKSTTGYLDENGMPSPMVKIGKRIDGTFYVIEAVNSSKKKKNYIVTAYIKQTK